MCIVFKLCVHESCVNAASYNAPGATWLLLLLLLLTVAALVLPLSPCCSSSCLQVDPLSVDY